MLSLHLSLGSPRGLSVPVALGGWAPSGPTAPTQPSLCPSRSGLPWRGVLGTTVGCREGPGHRREARRGRRAASPAGLLRRSLSKSRQICTVFNNT